MAILLRSPSATAQHDGHGASEGRERFGSPQESWKSRSFGEDVGKRLVHDFIGRGMEESGVLVDLSAVDSSRRMVAFIWWVWTISSNGIASLLMVVDWFGSWRSVDGCLPDGADNLHRIGLGQRAAKARTDGGLQAS